MIAFSGASTPPVRLPLGPSFATPEGAFSSRVKSAPMPRLKTTPFHPCTEPLMTAAQWRRWGGYQVASCYLASCDREYYAVRNSTAAFDISPLAKYRISGPDSLPYLQRLVTRDLSRLLPGKVIYTPWCEENGKVVDDGTVAALELDDGETVYQLTAAEDCLAWLELVARGYRVEIEDVTERFGVLALQGPTSLNLLLELLGPKVADLGFSEAAHFQTGAGPLWVSRTGYTGDLGYEIWCEASDAVALWTQVSELGVRYGLVPAGIWALDIARIEAGLIMLEVDYASASTVTQLGQTSSPFELGLGWAVSFDKGPFVGREALLSEKTEKSTPFHLTGLVLDLPSYREAFAVVGLPPCLPVQAWREVAPVFDTDGHQRGYATCGTWSPTLQELLVMIAVEPAFCAPETPLFFDMMVDRRRVRIPGRTVRLPFFHTQRKKAQYAAV